MKLIIKLADTHAYLDTDGEILNGDTILVKSFPTYAAAKTWVDTEMNMVLYGYVKRYYRQENYMIRSIEFEGE